MKKLSNYCRAFNRPESIKPYKFYYVIAKSDFCNSDLWDEMMKAHPLINDYKFTDYNGYRYIGINERDANEST